MTLPKRPTLEQLLGALVIAIVAGAVAELLLLRSNYLTVPATLAIGAACFVPVLRYVRAHRLPAPECASDRALPAESLVSNPSYQLRIRRTDNEQLVILSEARPNLSAGLMAVCPLGMLLVGPAALIWATVVEPPTHWVWYPPLLCLVVFLVWLGIAHVAMNLQQGFWGTTCLTFAGPRLSQRVTWCGREWIDRSYRIGPTASVRNDLSNWFGVMIRGLAPEPSMSWWKALLRMRPRKAISFGAALTLADAQLVAAFIQQHLQALRDHLRTEALQSDTGPLLPQDAGRECVAAELPSA